MKNEWTSGMKSGMHSDIAPQGLPKAAWWIQCVTWILENTNALHTWHGCQVNTTPPNKHLFQVLHCTSSKVAVTYAAHSGHQRSPSGTGTAHPHTSRRSCSWCCTAELQRDTQNQPKIPQRNELPQSLKWNPSDELCTICTIYFNCILVERFSQVFHNYEILIVLESI